MLSTQRKFSIGYFILTVLGLLLMQGVFFAPQRENLSYRDFKTLLKAGKVVDLLLGESTITGRLITDGMQGLLTPAQTEVLRKLGPGEQRFDRPDRRRLRRGVRHESVPVRVSFSGDPTGVAAAS